MSQYTLLFSLPLTTKVTKAFPDPSGRLLHAFGLILRHHEFYIEAKEESEEAHRALVQVREKEKETGGAGKRRVQAVYIDKC